MAGSTTVTGNKGTRRKTAARSRIKYGWRETARRNIAYIIKGELIAARAGRNAA